MIGWGLRGLRPKLKIETLVHTLAPFMAPPSKFISKRNISTARCKRQKKHVRIWSLHPGGWILAKSRRHKLRQAASEESDKKEEQQLHHGLRNWRKLRVSSTLTQLNRAVKNGHNRSPTASKKRSVSLFSSTWSIHVWASWVIAYKLCITFADGDSQSDILKPHWYW